MKKTLLIVALVSVFSICQAQDAAKLQKKAAAGDTKAMIDLAACYEGKEGGLIFWADIPDLDGFVMIGVQARKDEEFGLDEEALVEKNIRDIWDINKLFGEDRGPELGTAVFAGEEHPAAIHYIPKGDFLYLVTITVNNGEWEPLLALFDKA